MDNVENNFTHVQNDSRPGQSPNKNRHMHRSTQRVLVAATAFDSGKARQGKTRQTSENLAARHTTTTTTTHLMPPPRRAAHVVAVPEETEIASTPSPRFT